MKNNFENKKSFCTYTYVGDVCVREIVIDSEKGGDEITVGVIADPHFNKCNENDLKNPTLESTHKKRLWLKDGSSVPNAEKSLEAIADCDGMVVCGDALDYLSEGCAELLYSVIWDKYPDAIVTSGNHELAQKMQGEVEECLSIEKRIEMLEKIWKHDVFYTSRVLSDKVMLIGIDNSLIMRFTERVVEPLRRDLKLAREKGYTVLIFYHVPIVTEDPADDSLESSFVGDENSRVIKLSNYCVSPRSGGASLEVYELITNNADIIGGCFCGHMHADFYTEIVAKDVHGNSRPIPQYLLIGTPYNNGHALKIRVK